ncbi:MAG: four-carbon acid sugar kinase family protein [Deltaproteobacteria bacterium]|jgi:uncharacterized protein YgbK (DUF1537 family)|nr:four-carbon acid sugar kinase family protein [Deltaproteobacteria bacterium]
MIETLIIADTLTGCTDTAAKFTKSGPVKLVSLKKADWSGIKGVLAVNANTRAVEPSKIPEALGKIKSLLNDHRPRIIYKRIDSCLRGCVGHEIATALKTFDELDFALVAPADPELGRTTIKGVHMVEDKPIHTTQYSQDPVKPVLDSRLKMVMSEDHDLRVESLEIDEIRNGPDAIEQKLNEFLSKGTRFIVACDAEFDYDLDLLVKGSREFADRVLFSGSLGFAGILADLYATRNRNWLEDEFHPPVPQTPIIFFGGSYSKKLNEQFKILADEHDGEILTVNVENLLNDHGLTVPLLVHSRPLIITLPDKGDDEEFKEKYPLRVINEKFGILAADLVKNRQYKSIFISGGDLAMQTLMAMNLDELWIRSDLTQGIVFASAGQLSVLTKTADFGTPDILSRLFEELTRDDDWWLPKSD